MISRGLRGNFGSRERVAFTVLRLSLGPDQAISFRLEETHSLTENSREWIVWCGLIG